MQPELTARIPIVHRLIESFAGLGRTVLAFWIAYLLLNFGTGVSTLVLNLYLVEHGFGPDLIGAVNSFTTFGSAALAIPASWLGARLGDRGSFVLSAGCLGVSYLGQAMFPQAIPELAFSFVSGGALSLIVVTTVPFLSSRVPPERRAGVFATNFVVQAIGLMLGSLLGGFLPALIVGLLPGTAARSTGFAIALFVGGAVSLLSLALFWHLPAGRTPRRRPRIVAPSPHIGQPIHPDQAPFRGWGPIIFAGVGVPMALSYGLSGPFFNVYLDSELQATSAEIGAIFFAASLASIPAAMVGPALVRALGAAETVAIGRLIGVPLLGLIPLFPFTGVVGCAFVLRNVSMSLAWPTELAFWTDRLSPREQMRALAYRTMATNFTWSLAGLAGGQIVLRAGYPPVFLVSTALLASVGAVYLLAFRQRTAVATEAS